MWSLRLFSCIFENYLSKGVLSVTDSCNDESQGEKEGYWFLCVTGNSVVSMRRL